jgi:hypothetical protein
VAEPRSIERVEKPSRFVTAYGGSTIFFDLDGLALRIAEVQGENAVTAPFAEAGRGSIISDAIGRTKTSKKF